MKPWRGRGAGDQAFGPCCSAEDWAVFLSILEKQGITHIVCVRQNIEANFIKPNFPLKFRYLVLDIADNPVENIIRYFPMTKEFIDGCLESGGKVLVHGNAGISRSAALVIAYLMETFGVKYRDAFSHVQERRFCINPNVGFVHQLQEYEAIYLARLTIKMMSPIQLGRSFSIQAGMPGRVLSLHLTDPTAIVTDLQRAVVSSMSHPVSADGCTTQDYMRTDRYHDCP
ncbi:hypothetical protein NFI96_021526 [Prochilodus magdalenae]|nr:hypothetical protein NFI96_021526 [Prochilodus magdalenae]